MALSEPKLVWGTLRTSPNSRLDEIAQTKMPIIPSTPLVPQGRRNRGSKGSGRLRYSQLGRSGSQVSLPYATMSAMREPLTKNVEQGNALLQRDWSENSWRAGVSRKLLSIGTRHLQDCIFHSGPRLRNTLALQFLWTAAFGGYSVLALPVHTSCTFFVVAALSLHFPLTQTAFKRYMQEYTYCCVRKKYSLGFAKNKVLYLLGLNLPFCNATGDRAPWRVSKLHFRQKRGRNARHRALLSESEKSG